MAGRRSTAILFFAASFCVASLRAEELVKGTQAYEEYRKKNCQRFGFDVRFDAYPSDFGIVLESFDDGQVVWSKASHRYYGSHKFQNASDSTCLLPDECWRVSILDSELFQDGLTKLDNGNSSQAGAYTLTFGNETIGAYDGSEEEGACYESQWYLFGACAEDLAPTGSNGGLCGGTKDTAMESCREFDFRVITDEFPEDVRYVLQASNNETLWDESPWNQFHQNEEFRKRTCLEDDACYTFTVYDSRVFPHGLTDAPDGGRPGAFSLTFDGEMVGEYDGGSDGCYGGKWYKFGTNCDTEEGTMGSMECPDDEDAVTLQEAGGADEGDDEVTFLIEETTLCDRFSFSIVTDEFPEDTMFALTNAAGDFLWNERPWTIADQNIAFDHEICLDDDDCYTFVIYDDPQHQDGLVEVPEGGTAGSFLVTYGDEVLGTYDGAMDGCFAAKGYRFGSGCPAGTILSDTAGGCQDNVVEAALPEDTPNCVGFQFFITTDDYPEDSHVMLTDSVGNKIWDESPWNQKNTGQTFDRDICLDPLDCYNFTIFDSPTFGDGLTKAPPGGVPGSFNLTYGSGFMASYDGATDGCFSTKWFQWGEACSIDEPLSGTVGEDCLGTSSIAVAEDENDCVSLQFLVMTDNFPEDISLTLTASKSRQTIWDGLRPWNQKNIGQVVEKQICLEPKDCYTFTVDDTYHDGLTKTTPNGTVGNYFVTYGSQSIDVYMGESDGCYSSKWYRFGAECDAVFIERGAIEGDCEKGADVVTESAEEMAPDGAVFVYTGDDTTGGSSEEVFESSASGPAFTLTIGDEALNAEEDVVVAQPIAAAFTVTGEDTTLAAGSEDDADSPVNAATFTVTGEDTVPLESEEEHSAAASQPTAATFTVTGEDSTLPAGSEGVVSDDAPVVIAAAFTVTGENTVPIASEEEDVAAEDELDQAADEEPHLEEESSANSTEAVHIAAMFKVSGASSLSTTTEEDPSEYSVENDIVARTSSLSATFSVTPDEEVPTQIVVVQETTEFVVEETQINGTTSTVEGSPIGSVINGESEGDLTKDDAKIASATFTVTPEDFASTGDDDDDGCRELHFMVSMDRFPEDIVLHLVESNVTEAVWDNESPWTPQHVGQMFDKMTCLNPNSCYTLVIRDAFDDGLTKDLVDNGEPGSFVVAFGDETIGSYNGDADGCYTKMWYRFGGGCYSTDSGKTVGLCTVEPEPEVVVEETPPPQVAADCDMEMLRFVVQTDSFPEDIVLSLIESNTNETMWDEERPWNQQDVGKLFDKDVCLDPKACYVLTIGDTYDDGMTKDHEQTGEPGSFIVSFGSETIGYYHGDVDGCYTMMWYRFGAGCGSAGVESGKVVGENCEVEEEEPEVWTTPAPTAAPRAEDCDGIPLVFSVQTDSFPEDIVLTLTGGSSDHTVWDSLRPWNQNHVNQTVNKVACLRPDECYTLRVDDTYSDGLSKGEQGGAFEVEYGSETIAVYDAADDGCYASKEYTFGPGCLSTEVSDPEDGMCGPPVTRQ